MPSAMTRRMMSGAKAQAGLPVGRPASRAGIGLRQRDRRNAEYRALHGARDGAGIGHIVGGVDAAIDAGEHEIGRPCRSSDGARHHHAIGRRAGDRKMPIGDLRSATES